MPLSTQPYRGARDFYPPDMRLRNYIFDTWKQVCRRYGFEEYDFPILEPLEIFAAKTGEEIVNQQLFKFEDQGGRKLAIRPELTPGTVRMLAAKYGELVKPVRWFMIGNNWRYEKPQKGRGREFYQLEANIFGVPGIMADFEIFSLMIDIMIAFGASEQNFTLNFSDRRLVKALLNDYLKLDNDKQLDVRRFMDKRLKMSAEDFLAGLRDLNLSADQSNKVEQFMQSDFSNLTQTIPQEYLENNSGYLAVKQLISLLDNNGLAKYCKFDPSIIRGFDYSDGLVYEVFDQNPDNRRSMFGGERFDNLIKIFGDKYQLEATGFAMGDYTLLEFLKGWDLLPDFKSDTTVLVAFTESPIRDSAYQLTQQLRQSGISAVVTLENQPLDKQLKYADKKNIPWVVIVRPEEAKTNTVQLKNMLTGDQLTTTVAQLPDLLRRVTDSAQSLE